MPHFLSIWSFFISLPLAGDIKDTNKIKGPRKINIEIIYQKSFNKKYMSETLNNYPKHKKNLRHVTYGIQYFCSILQYFFTHYFADNIRDPGWQWFWICSFGRLSHLYLPGEQNIVIIIILIMTIININTGPWVDRVPVSVSEWLLGSFVLIQYLSNSTNIRKYWDDNAVYSNVFEFFLFPSQPNNQLQCVMIPRCKSGARLFMACEQMFQIIFFLRKNRFLLLTYSQSDLSYSHLVSQQEITPM